MKILVTGGAGFIGSHAAEHYANKGCEVVVLDNLSRLRMLGKSTGTQLFNWQHLDGFSNIKLIEGDVLDFETVSRVMKNVDLVIHAAGQTAVTSSYVDPILDFSVNAQGTLHVLEAARRLSRSPVIIYCSTNKVYGSNVNSISLAERPTRHVFKPRKFQKGIDESFGIDLCERSPYGCSKLTADLYAQDYAHHHGLKVGVFRMSCIYGTRQFGVEDQGWVAWFAIAMLSGKPITIYGNGKQVRDLLYVSDLIQAFDRYVERGNGHEVFNMGGGHENAVSVIEAIDFLSQLTGKKADLRYDDWRPNDQKVYVSDIGKAKKRLGWFPKTSVQDGMTQLVRWLKLNENVLKRTSKPQTALAETF